MDIAALNEKYPWLKWVAGGLALGGVALVARGRRSGAGVVPVPASTPRAPAPTPGPAPGADLSGLQGMLGSFLTAQASMLTQAQAQERQTMAGFLASLQRSYQQARPSYTTETQHQTSASTVPDVADDAPLIKLFDVDLWSPDGGYRQVAVKADNAFEMAIADLKAQFRRAELAGDTAGMNAANADATRLRQIADEKGVQLDEWTGSGGYTPIPQIQAGPVSSIRAGMTTVM